MEQKNTGRKWVRGSIAVFIGLLLLAATLPSTGGLRPDGVPLATGDYELTFCIYGAATGGSPVWGPCGGCKRAEYACTCDE